MESASRQHQTLSTIASAPAREPAPAPDDTPWSGEDVIDCHFHERATEQAMIAHLDGAAISSALVLSFGNFESRMVELERTQPRRFAGWGLGAQLVPTQRTTGDVSESPFDMTRVMSVGAASDAIATLSSLKSGGWKGFAETAGSVAVDGPELQRLYALAAELDVPVMMHFQEAEVPGQPAYGIKGFSRIESMLKKHPNTKFVCHAPDFWGNIDSQYRDGGIYLSGPVSRGGLSDRLLGEYPNMYGDLGAPSALIQLTRDVDFTAEFLERNRGKLMFGSDCGCADGRGGNPDGLAWPPSTNTPPQGKAAPDSKFDPEKASAMQTAMTSLGGLAGKCIARELLAVSWKTTSRDLFRQLTSINATRVYGLA